MPTSNNKNVITNVTIPCTISVLNKLFANIDFLSSTVSSDRHKLYQKYLTTVINNSMKSSY